MMIYLLANYYHNKSYTYKKIIPTTQYTFKMSSIDVITQINNIPLLLFFLSSFFLVIIFWLILNISVLPIHHHFPTNFILYNHAKYRKWLTLVAVQKSGTTKKIPCVFPHGMSLSKLVKCKWQFEGLYYKPLLIIQHVFQGDYSLYCMFHCTAITVEYDPLLPSLILSYYWCISWQCYQ